ncbi:protein sprouty homolog 3 [Girardinichthys multiradiatus]|uniref:protein sprouty homolog 3 n=1 Tax=Girardinichthys multiradiatus TaxID=208333 RepID=UPI001FABEDEA|nr:protein sprouty homolog 3 [Girardinichthys multiradiatus]XP_047235840.1 protein sprouty homolog 3 [Girardinichthys multiradiatus]XP_047235841.1 protein sprouty homolog 3 [Girardinichthys multiradiatus]
MEHTHSLRNELDSVLSLEEIRAIRANNDYVERPVALEPASQSGFYYAHEDRIVYGHQPQTSSFSALSHSQSQQQHAHLAHLSRSSTVSSSISRTSATSNQRLLAGLTPSHSGFSSVVHTQPKGELKSDSFFGKGLTDEETEHLFICERCARCKCQECCSPRRLPSCWACGQRCLCSAESVVEYCTCLCCVKGLFYHCSAQDDEDNCADRPCSCTPANACARWSTMALLALCLPCLCCYPPARMCLALCQCAHDRATRPGCRCSNTNTVCRKISASNPNAGHPPLRSKDLEQSL